MQALLAACLTPQANSIPIAATGIIRENKKPAIVRRLALFILVEVGGVEPPTSGL
jgi:hypothetical protein